MEYKLVRSKRKTLAIKITPDCQVVVLAPKKCSVDLINKFVFEKQNWIQEKLILQKQIRKDYEKYEKLDELMLFGQSYIIKDFGKYFLVGDNYIKHTKAGNKKKILKDFLVKQANEYIISRATFIAEKLGLKYKSMQIISARTIWGSCNNLKQLKFNFRLAMIPKNLIDYVICHELCHLKELNHSKKFWELLNELGYKKTIVKEAIKNYAFVLQLF